MKKTGKKQLFRLKPHKNADNNAKIRPDKDLGVLGKPAKLVKSAKIPKICLFLTLIKAKSHIIVEKWNEVIDNR